MSVGFLPATAGVFVFDEFELDAQCYQLRRRGVEMKLENVDGKKILTAKDGQGKLLFSGPVETKEEIDKLPPEVRQRYEKLEQNDLPTIAPPEAPNASDEGPDDADEEVVNQV